MNKNISNESIRNVKQTSAIVFWMGVPVNNKRFLQLYPSKTFQRRLKF